MKTTKQRLKGAASLILAAGLAALLITACGPSSEEQAAAELADCETALLEASDTLTMMYNELDGAGLTYDEHSEYLEEIRDQEGIISPGEVSATCEELVLAPMDDAISHYEDADWEWNSCLYDDDYRYCDAPGSEQAIQDAWSSAEDDIQDMQAGWDEMREAAGIDTSSSVSDSDSVGSAS